MRRLSMKSKRRKSDTTSGSESEENGVTRTAGNSSSDENDERGNVESAREKTMTPTRRSSPKKRTPRTSRHSQKVTSEEPVGGTHNEPADTTQSIDEDEEENGNVGKGGASKRRKKEDQKASTSSQDTDEEKEYEVEKIVGQRTIKGRRQFLVRWKGYDEDSDTWEQEKDLNCPKLIEDFLSEEADNEEDEEEEESGKTEKLMRLAKSAPSKITRRSKKIGAGAKKQIDNGKQLFADEISSDKDGQKEFEVEKIIEVHFKKNKKREFLIRWKGFTPADDTWEPEENLNCPDLIAKFMDKVEKAKTTDLRELRTNRVHTKRYTLATHDAGRRLSRRNMDKQRTMYYECDE